MAAPTMSELIRRLERELGTPLFTRTTRRVALTSAGAELLTRSKGILDEIAAADAAVRRVPAGRRARCGSASPLRWRQCWPRTSSAVSRPVRRR